MLILRQLRFLTAILSIFLILGLTGCKTTPEAEPEEEAVVEEPAEPEAQPEPEPTPETVAPLSQEDIDAARSAVQRAADIGANSYFHPEFTVLTADLDDGIAMGDSDPDAARAALTKVITDADALYERTLTTRYGEYANQISDYDKALLSIDADKFTPVRYEATKKMAEEAQSYYDWGDLAGALSTANDTMKAQYKLYYNLNENIRYVTILIRDTENYLSDAEANEAFLYAPDELDTANSLYLDGMTAFREYQIIDSADMLTEAKRNAILAARRAAIQGQRSRTDELMRDTQKRIEDASNLRTLDEEGDVIEAQPWSGEEYLQDNPLSDESTDVGDVEIEESGLRDLDAPVDSEAGSVPEDIPIDEDGTQVNADEQMTDYLAFAKILWEKGVTARNAGQYDLAQDYFRQAQAYIDVYEANAVSKTYTVVYRETATDCLWRISEMNDIFDNPYLWPKLWRANRRIIQNPDLIYPGQILVIPPK